MRVFTYAAVAVLFIIGCKDKLDPILKIKPPFQAVDFPSQQFTINPSVKQVARFDNGMRVEIPENAFQDASGNVIDEDVILTLSTYETAAQIIISGIPMVYHEANERKNFESAGMFRISGYSDSTEVFIRPGKELVVNYPSKVYGDFDFFHFDQEHRDSVISGQWKKLTTETTKTEWSADTLEKFKLKFTKEDYPALAPLSGIDWKLAKSNENPIEKIPAWVLEEAWSSLEISQPKYGFGKTIFEDTVNYDFLWEGVIMISKDKRRIITSNKPITKIWNREGKLIKTIDKVRDHSSPVRLLNEKFLLVSREHGDDIFDFDGNLIGQHPKTRHLELAHSNEIVIYYDWGTTEPIVNISTIAGKLIKKIELWEDVYSWHEPNIYEQFFLTKNDELITNSLDGIQFFDLDANLLAHRDEEFLDIDNIKENWLMMKGMDGELTVWDYINNWEITSNPKDFDLRMKVKRENNSWHYYYSYYHFIQNTTLVLIREATSKHSKLWDYKNNEVTELDFHMFDFIPTHILAGYDYNKGVFHLYDAVKKKNILSISGFDPGLDIEGSAYNASLSDDGRQLLISNNTHARYYQVDGTLIRDFKSIDSLIQLSQFRGTDEILTLSKDGVYRIWNRSGEELSSKQLRIDPFNQSWISEDQLTTWNSTFKNHSHFNLSGDLLISPGRERRVLTMDSTQVLFANETGTAVLRSLFELPSPVYQLLLRTDKKEFLTYVYLDENDLQIINQYYTFRTGQIQQEEGRKQNENLVLRRFRLDQFGLYNWDIMMKEEGNIQFTATFEFDIPTDYNSIMIFLITEFNGRAVILFNNSTWGEFRINPGRKNQLLAILPDNKVAIFGQEEMDAVDFNAIREQKAFTFKMKTMDNSIQDLMDLEEMIP